MYSAQDDIKRLNSFLRGEHTAVETYTQAIENLNSEPVVEGLKLIRDSHQKRVTTLTERIALLGGAADHDPSAFKTLATLVEGGAGLVSAVTAMAVLEKGEEMGHGDYNNALDLTQETRRFVCVHLIPEQERTRDAMISLRRELSAEAS